MLATMMHEASRASTLPQEPKRRVQARSYKSRRCRVQARSYKSRRCRVQARSHKSRSRRVQARSHSAQGWPTATSESRPERAIRSADAGAQFEWAAGLGLDLVQTHARVKFGQGQATTFGDFEHAQVGDDEIHHAHAGDRQFTLLEDLW